MSFKNDLNIQLLRNSYIHNTYIGLYRTNSMFFIEVVLPKEDPESDIITWLKEEKQAIAYYYKIVNDLIILAGKNGVETIGNT